MYFQLALRFYLVDKKSCHTSCLDSNLNYHYLVKIFLSHGVVLDFL